jgi:hypothetical protein
MARKTGGHHFVDFLNALGRITGDGLGALIFIQLFSTLVVFAFSGASWLLLRELFGERRAQYTGFVLLFMPLSLYFSYMVLSELVLRNGSLKKSLTGQGVILDDE